MSINNRDVEKTEESAAEFQGSRQSTGYENVKKYIADQLHSVAEALDNNGAEQRAEAGVEKYRQQASEWLNQSAEYVRTFDHKQADASIRDYVKQSPGRSLLFAGGVGLIIGAILRRR